MADPPPLAWNPELLDLEPCLPHGQGTRLSQAAGAQWPRSGRGRAAPGKVLSDKKSDRQRDGRDSFPPRHPKSAWADRWAFLWAL